MQTGRNDKFLYREPYQLPLNNRKIVIIGKARKKKSTHTSRAKRIIKISKSTIIRTVLTAIPIPIEKPTNPSRYSFFKGLKNVLRKSGRENN